MTPAAALILLLEDFQVLGPVTQLSAAAGSVGALGGPIFWAWRKGRKNAAELVETNSKLKQELEDSSVRCRKIERGIEDHHRTLPLLKAQQPAAVLEHAVADKTHAREILSELFEQLAPVVANCCREMATVEVALTLNVADRPHLQRGEWLAQTAGLLAPEGNDGLQDLLAEINAISAVWEEERGASAAASMFWNVSFDYVGGGRADVAIPLSHRLNETGERRHQEGHYAVAAVLLRRAVLLAHRSLGPEHPHTLATRHNLAFALNAQGRSAEAEEMYREVLPLEEKVLGREHPDTLRTRHNLAFALSTQGRSAEAEEMYREVLPLQEKVLSREHPDTLRTRSNMAFALSTQGRSAEAETICREVLPLQEKVLGREHRHTLATRNNLAYALNAQGHSVEAETICREVLPFLEEVLGREHPDTLTVRSNLAFALNAQGRSAEAETICREVLPFLEEVLGREHPHTLATRNNLAYALSAQGRCRGGDDVSTSVTG